MSSKLPHPIPIIETGTSLQDNQANVQTFKQIINNFLTYSQCSGIKFGLAPNFSTERDDVQFQILLSRGVTSPRNGHI